MEQRYYALISSHAHCAMAAEITIANILNVRNVLMKTSHIIFATQSSILPIGLKK